MIPEEVLAYARIRNEYKPKLEAVRPAMMATIQDLYDKGELDEEAIAEALGWKIESVLRAVGAIAPKEPKNELPLRVRVLALVPEQWTEAGDLYRDISQLLGRSEYTIKGTLKRLYNDGEIAAKGRKTRYMGKDGYRQTHYKQRDASEAFLGL